MTVRIVAARPRLCSALQCLCSAHKAQYNSLQFFLSCRVPLQPSNDDLHFAFFLSFFRYRRIELNLFWKPKLKCYVIILYFNRSFVQSLLAWRVHRALRGLFNGLVQRQVPSWSWSKKQTRKGTCNYCYLLCSSLRAVWCWKRLLN